MRLPAPAPDQPRTLPLRVQPVAGEALDSWLRRLAHRNGVSLRRLTHLFGLDERLRIWRNYALTKDLPATILRRIESQTALAPGTLDATVLNQFDDLGWTPIPGSRYCPECLTTNGGWWPLRWQLPHTFVCILHRCLLAVVCPTCGRIPHNRISQRAGLNDTTRCVQGSTRHGRPCDADLLTTPWPAPLGDHDPRIAAQTWINQRLDSMHSAAVIDLQDLDALAGWLPSRLMPADLEHLGHESVTAFAVYRENHNALRRHNPDASLMAAAIACRAIDIINRAALGDPSDAHLRATLAPFTRNAHHAYRDGHQPAKPTGGLKVLSSARLASVSPALQRAVLRGIDQDLSATERLRYRTRTPAPRLPEQPSPQADADRARWIPQRLWPDWLVRFAPTTLRGRATEVALTVAAALLIPGNPTRNNGATHELTRWRVDLGITLASLAQTYPDVLTAICNLAAHLDEHRAPIDYRRRRAVFTTIDLASDQWLALTTVGQIRRGNGARALHARRYLFALLTGADLDDPRHELALSAPGDRSRYRAFELQMPTTLRIALEDHASDLLARAGVDEPLTWGPPADTVAGLSLPGREPDDIDTELLRKMILIDQARPRVAAELLGVSTHHVRYTIGHQHWAAADPWPRRPVKNSGIEQSPRPMTALRARAERLLTPEFFEREHTLAGKSLPTLATETGFTPTLISQYAQRTGIQLVVRKLGDRLRNEQAAGNDNGIDPDWLREQAGTRRRTNTDIARELGLSHETIRKLRSDLGIPAVARGIYNDTLHPELPVEIRRAVEGHRAGWQRLRRFQEVVPYHSINRAAAGLGHHGQNLNLQIQRLEEHLGALLLTRGHRYQPMSLTTPGQRILDQLEQPAVRALLDAHAPPGEHQHRRPYRRDGQLPAHDSRITTER